ncbi:unnamed protein product [Ectocarpus sp. 4 AP-2014]
MMVYRRAASFVASAGKRAGFERSVVRGAAAAAAVERHKGTLAHLSRPSKHHHDASSSMAGAAGLLAAAACLSTAAVFQQDSQERPACKRAAKAGGKRDGFPVISKAEVAKHKSAEAGGVWVTYDGGVYDITEFIASHPGGASRISMAAGGALEPFWQLYALHMKDEVLDILKTLRIGSLSLEDMAEHKSNADKNSDDPYAKDPARHPFFVVNNPRPFNAEPPPELLLDAGFITPNDLYYVRNHLPVPDVDPDKYRLHVEVEGKGARCLQYSLEDLKTKFPQVKVVTAIQCAGNRREDMTNVKPVKGLGWSCGAISNSEWTGVLLRDVLENAGVNVNDPESSGIEHVQFEAGLDRDLTTCYGSSIPAGMAVDPKGDVLLAFEMNGEPIPRDHGFPVRAVVPGVVGARNVKWLDKVIASKEESKNHWQQKDYKGFNSSTDWDTADFSKASLSPAIQQLPINSAILSPADGSSVSQYDDEVTVKGYAVAGGGRAVVRVDVSADGGETWTSAELKPTSQPLYRTWAWTLWEASLPVPKGKGEMKLVCKAVDAGYNSQPERPEPIWNIRGVLSNSWHRVGLKVEDE